MRGTRFPPKPPAFLLSLPFHSHCSISAVSLFPSPIHPTSRFQNPPGHPAHHTVLTQTPAPRPGQLIRVQAPGQRPWKGRQ